MRMTFKTKKTIQSFTSSLNVFLLPPSFTVFNFAVFKQAATAAVSISQIFQLPRFLCLWIWRLTTMKFHHDSGVKTSADSDYSLSKYILRLRSRKHTRFLPNYKRCWASVTHSGRARKTSWGRLQGAGSPLITQQECWYLQNQRGLRGEGSWLKDALGIFQLESYSELRSLGIFKCFPNCCKRKSLKLLHSENCYWSRNSSKHLHEGFQWL